jgi:arginyl-tRNA synthetase
VLYVRFHEEAEKDSSLEEKAREASKKLEEEDKILRQFWKDVIAITKKSLAELYARLHVSFDLDLGESFYEDKMEPVLQEGIKKKVFKEGEKGALIVEFPEETNMPPYVVRRSDGGTLYSTRDIAQMRYRIDTYHPKAIYILTDVAQKQEVPKQIKRSQLLFPRVEKEVYRHHLCLLHHCNL